jgi:hypothetical protein
MPRYFDFKVSLSDIQPDIWRRFLLAENATFEDLHEAIQDAFGWESDHLFEFRDKKGKNAIACADIDDEFSDEDAPAAGELTLASFFTKKGTKCQYVYDFGDDWKHAVELVGVVELPDKCERRLLGGARACPPEDCGGVWGYEECVKVASMSEEEAEKEGDDCVERKEWVGDWNPEAFDLQVAKKEFDE